MKEKLTNVKLCLTCEEANPVAKKTCRCGYVFPPKWKKKLNETPIVLTSDRLRAKRVDENETDNCYSEAMQDRLLNIMIKEEKRAKKRRRLDSIAKQYPKRNRVVNTKYLANMPCQKATSVQNNLFTDMCFIKLERLHCLQKEEQIPIFIDNTHVKKAFRIKPIVNECIGPAKSKLGTKNNRTNKNQRLHNSGQNVFKNKVDTIRTNNLDTESDDDNTPLKQIADKLSEDEDTPLKQISDRLILLKTIRAKNLSTSSENKVVTSNCNLSQQTTTSTLHNFQNNVLIRQTSGVGNIMYPMKRPKGRPRIHPKSDPNAPKRPRGRPRKDGSAITSQVKRKRGRPKGSKDKVEGRKRGRPSLMSPSGRRYDRDDRFNMPNYVIPEEKRELFALVLKEINRKIISQSHNMY